MNAPTTEARYNSLRRCSTLFAIVILLQGLAIAYLLVR
jgi:hypothetical protein